MSSSNYYDVTKWPVGDPSEDVGEVINSMIADIKIAADLQHDGRREAAGQSSTSLRGTTASAPR